MAKTAIVIPAISISYSTTGGTSTYTSLSNSPLLMTLPPTHNYAVLDDTDLSSTCSQSALGIAEPGSSDVTIRYDDTEYTTLESLASPKANIYFKIPVTSTKRLVGYGLINGLVEQATAKEKMQTSFTIIWNSAVTREAIA